MTRQNGARQNGADKMAPTKWRGDKMARDKKAPTKWRVGRYKIGHKDEVSLINGGKLGTFSIPLPLGGWGDASPPTLWIREGTGGRSPSPTPEFLDDAANFVNCLLTAYLLTY